MSGLELCAVMIDGIHVGGHVVRTALGIDDGGEKHVLGLYDGATENATVCTELLVDLRSRGLHTNRTMLFVLDGSKALAKLCALSSASVRSSNAAKSTSDVTSKTTCPRT